MTNHGLAESPEFAWRKDASNYEVQYEGPNGPEKQWMTAAAIGSLFVVVVFSTRADSWIAKDMAHIATLQADKVERIASQLK